MNGSRMEKRPLVAAAVAVLFLLAANCSCGMLSGGGEERSPAAAEDMPGYFMR